MPDADHIWTPLYRETLLTTPYYAVTRDRVRHPLGRDVDYYVIRNRRAAAGIVPADDVGNILLVQQWRHPVQKLLWSVPAGAVDDGESPVQAARRELWEEAGCRASTVEPLRAYHPSVGVSSQTYHLFVARGLVFPGKPDPGEIVATDWFSRRQINAMIDDGEVQDGLSLTALLLWMRKG